MRALILAILCLASAAVAEPIDPANVQVIDGDTSRVEQP